MKFIKMAKGTLGASGAFFVVLAIMGMAGCAARSVTVGMDGQLIKPEIVKLIDEHTLSVAVIYSMPEEEWQRRMERKVRGGVEKWEDLELSRWQQVIPLGLVQEAPDGKPIKYIAYIGAATAIKDNHALTVAHLFSHTENTHGYRAWVFKDGLTKAVEAELVVKSNYGAGNWYDYAIIRMKENLGLPGLGVAQREPEKFEMVIASGSVGGLAFFSRACFITKLGKYFKRSTEGVLTLTSWEAFDFWTISPAGPGDSGGSVKNTQSGEIYTILYQGINVHGENYVFGNPNEKLWQFLRENKLEHLAR